MDDNMRNFWQPQDDEDSWKRRPMSYYRGKKPRGGDIPDDRTRKMSERIASHRKFYDDFERNPNRKLLLYYQGRFFDDQRFNYTQGSARYVYGASKNLIFALVDTVLSAIIGPDPTCAATSIGGQSDEESLLATANMTHIFHENVMRRVCRIALTDACLFGRGTFKVGWDPEKSVPLISTVDIDAFYFDLSTKYPGKIRYKFECTPITMETFRKRQECGLYPMDIEIRPDQRPSWLGPDKPRPIKNAVEAVDDWVTVWEYYDIENKKVYHLLDQKWTILLEDDLAYDPYVTFEMNFNGEDCRGLSEARLILSDQETVNDILSHIKNIAYLIIPRIMYNAGLISEEDLNATVAASTGAFVPVKAGNASLPPDAWKSAFFPAPTPIIDPQLYQFLEVTEANAGYASAVMEMSRAQPSGEKTATAVAVQDQFNRNRISNREGNFYECMEKIAGLAWELDTKKLDVEREIEVTKDGETALHKIDLGSIREMKVKWKWNAYNAVKNNPLVVAETIQKFLQFMLQSPVHDQYKLWKYLHEILGIPMDVLKTQEMIEQEKQKEAQAAPPMGAMPPEAAGAPVAPPGALPPEAMVAPMPPGSMPPGTLPAGPQNVPPSVVQEVANMSPDEIAKVAQQMGIP